ncbi:sarcosine oxidase subunit gamma [Litchfieldella rifensis]|uniref:Sarcosine oxidase subunit gamma n=1 Tax=Litchfieldella rifensis TaxID=762643 RepID=A0ABV7LUV2_9GAMM
MAEGITTQARAIQVQACQQRQSALAGIETRTHPRVRISASQPSAMLSVQGVDDAAALASLGNHRALLWTGPARRMVVAEHESPQALAAALADLPEDVMVTDVSHAWCRLILEGSGAHELLQSGIGLDLSPAVWPVGHSTSTAFREVQVLLHATGPDRFDLYTFRSVALCLWQWLDDGAAGL